MISGLGFETADRYGRYLQADFDKVSIATPLLPSGQSGDESLNQKFKFMDDFTHYLSKQRRKRREYIYCRLAVRRPSEDGCEELARMSADAGLPRARTGWLDEVFGNLGYADALREVSREGDQFSWWPDSEQAEMLNLGWRFDTRC